MILSGQMDAVSFAAFRAIGIGDDWARQMRIDLAESGLLLKSGNRYSINYSEINRVAA